MPRSGGLGSDIDIVPFDGISTAAIFAHGNLRIGPIADIPRIELGFRRGMNGYITGILSISPTGIDGTVIDFNARRAHHLAYRSDFNISAIFRIRRRIDISIFDRNHAVYRFIFRVSLQFRIIRRGGEANLAPIGAKGRFGRTFPFHVKVVFGNKINRSSIGN